MESPRVIILKHGIVFCVKFGGSTLIVSLCQVAQSINNGLESKGMVNEIPIFADLFPRIHDSKYFFLSSITFQPIPDKNGAGEDEDRMVDLSELNPAQRIHHLERSIMFLKQQHTEVLKSLHEEIETLKKENKGITVSRTTKWLQL